jgi:two-component system, LytTR family, sensor kinase
VGAFRVPNFLAADISFETVILLGLLLGPGWAMLGGGVFSGPAVYHHEYLACPSTPFWASRPACWAALSNGRDLVLHALSLT